MQKEPLAADAIIQWLLPTRFMGQCRLNALSIQTAIQSLGFQKLNKQNAQQNKIKAICNNPQIRCIHPQTGTWWKPMHWGIGLNISLGSRKPKGVLNAMLSCLRTREEKITQKKQSGYAACFLLNSVSQLPLMQPDTANFGIRVWNENQYLFWAWKQWLYLGQSMARHLFSVIHKWSNRNFQFRALQTHIQMKSDCLGGINYVAFSHPSKVCYAFPGFLCFLS